MANFLSFFKVFFYTFFLGLNLFSLKVFTQGTNCTNAIDLCSITSPYSSTTVGKVNDFTFCSMNSSEDMIFYVDLPNGTTITIGQTVNGYDSRHSLRRGGACPGTTQVNCTDDPDIGNVVYTNTTGSTERIFWIQAGFSTGAGTFTLAWSFSSPPCAPSTCNDPSALNATGITPTTANLSWTENGTATTWDVEYEISPFTFSGTPDFNTTTNPHTLTGLTPSTTYRYKVRANCGALQSNWIGFFQFTTAACNIQAPSGLTATNITNASANLGWTENGNSSTWDIELGPAGFSPTGIPTANNVTSNPYTYSGLSATTSYDFYVRAECGSNSAWVGPFNFTTVSTPSNYTSQMTAGWAKGVTQGADGNYLYVGNVNNDMYVVKTTQGGDTIWKKTIGSTGDERAYDVVNSGDGGYVIVGATNSATLISNTGYDVMVTKIASDGAHVWTRVVGSAGNDCGFDGAAIMRNPDGTFAIATSTGSSDMAIIKLAADGTFIAMKDLNSQSGRAYAITKATGTNSGWVVAGYLSVGGASEFMVTKVKEDLTYDWSMRWGDNTSSLEEIRAIIENGPNDYTVLGNTAAEGATPANMYAMRFTNSGAGPTVTWEKAYGTTVGSKIYDAALAADGNYIATGLNSAAGAGTWSDTYLLKINASNGNIIWQTEKTDDGASNRQGDGVYIESAGSYLVAGLRGFDMLKFAPDGSICGSVPGTLTTDDLGTTLANVDLTEGLSNNTFGASNAAKMPTITEFGVFNPGCNIVLPIVLGSINVNCENGKIVVEWSTFTEINNDYFTLEKSEDGIKFEEVVRIKGAGNSNNIETYKLVDESNNDTRWYYRLKQTDYNGQYSYSEIKTTSCDLENLFTIYPNPFENEIQILYNKLDIEKVEVNIIDYLGRKVDFVYSMESNKISIVFDNKLNSGLYFLTISNENTKIFSQKIIKH